MSKYWIISGMILYGFVHSVQAAGCAAAKAEPAACSDAKPACTTTACAEEAKCAETSDCESACETKEAAPCATEAGCGTVADGKVESACGHMPEADTAVMECCPGPHEAGKDVAEVASSRRWWQFWR